MKVRQALNQTIIVWLALSVSSSLGACQLLKGGKIGAGGSGKSSAATAGGADAKNAALLNGAWQVSYALNGETQSAHMTLNPGAGGFEGTGTDDSNGTNFIIDTGFLASNTVGFHKRYHVDENPNLAPIVYDGTFEVVSNPAYKGPYMHGSYKVDAGNGPAAGAGRLGRSESGRPGSQWRSQ